MTKEIKRRTKAVERELAAELGGRRVFNSGAGEDKGDVVVRPQVTMDGDVPHYASAGLRVESKITSKTAYSLTADTWLAVRNASRGGELPVMQIITHARRPFHCEWAVMDYAVAGPLLLTCALSPKREDVRSYTISSPVRPPFGNLGALKRITFRGGYSVLIFSWDMFMTTVLKSLT